MVAVFNKGEFPPIEYPNNMREYTEPGLKETSISTFF
jgi:hypothetical protein